MKQTKFLKPMLSLALVAALAVGGTLAYLQAQTEEVTNAFTFSDDDAVDITLTEETFGTPGNTDPVSMTPGDEIDKDPEITVTGQDCFIYVDVTESCAINGFDFSDFIDYSIDSNWEEVSGITTNPAGTKTYVYTGGTGTPAVVSTSDTDLYILAGNKVLVKDTVTEEMLALAKDNNPALSFIGYAIQQENIAPADANATFIATFKAP